MIANYVILLQSVKLQDFVCQGDESSDDLFIINVLNLVGMPTVYKYGLWNIYGLCPLKHELF